MNSTTLGPIGVKAFEGRGISAETAARFGVYTAERTVDGKVEPSDRGNIIVFPFFEHGVVVNEKYRGPGKKFWQRQGGKRTFWNADALDDPALEDGGQALIITEGEPDALTAIDCGFPLTVSVPDGAPGVPEGEKPDDLKEADPRADGKGKFEFIWNNRERLKRVKRFIIAVDNDAPGQCLAAELVRRLFPGRCRFVTYPEGCKDLNDVRMKHGADAVVTVLNGSQPYPVRGLYRLSEYPEHDTVHTVSTGWSTLDRHLRLFPGEFMVVTGIPGHGKSTWVLNLLCNLAESHGWCSAIFSPEMPTVPNLRDKLRRVRLRRPLFDLDRAETSDVDDWLERHFLFIDGNPNGRDEDDYDLDWLLDRATDAVMRDGIRILVIDPWNEVEHAKRRDETTTDYIGRSIRAIKQFARLYDVAVIVVAHPTKEVARDGKGRPVTLYDIEGSAHWFNKCDHGVVVDCPDVNIGQSVIHVKKSRFEEAGERGKVTLKFDRLSGRYELLEPAEAIE